MDEYRQKVKVTTAGPLDRTARVPTISSWRVTIFAIVVVFLGIALSLAGIYMHWAPAALTGSIGKKKKKRGKSRKIKSFYKSKGKKKAFYFIKD